MTAHAGIDTEATPAAGPPRPEPALHFDAPTTDGRNLLSKKRGKSASATSAARSPRTVSGRI